VYSIMILTHVARMLGDALLALAYPQTCAICGRSVEERRFGVACEACWTKTLVFDGTELLCWKCGLRTPGEVVNEYRDQVRCHRCDSHAFTAARAIGLYEGALREAVLHLKRKAHVPEHIAMLLVAAARREPLNLCTRIVPVPLHPKRLRARGFNQASVLADALSSRLQLPLDQASLLRVAASEKYRAGLDSKGRRDTVTGAFEVSHPRMVAGEDILLVDDVFTTGATASECAEVLITAGARNVFVLTLARA
jgi:ComF family protein